MDQRVASQALPVKTIIKGKNKYMVEKVLGAGGFGITYRVVTYHGNIAIRFAVKSISRQICANALTDGLATQAR